MFMGHSAAEGMLEKFSECVWRLTLAKLVRISYGLSKLELIQNDPA